MSVLYIFHHPLDRPKVALVLCLLVWKLLLFCIAIVSPGAGYDTSTTLLQLDGQLANSTSKSGLGFPLKLESLVRWDAIYFTQIAQNGYVWEQEWAFGWGFTRLIALIGKGLTSCGYPRSIGTETIAGILISHVSHLCSVLVLHELTLTVYRGSTAHQLSKVSFLAACLHIISPAGMFLSAPYAESSFSLLNLAGYYLYAKAKTSARAQGSKGDALIVFSGILFGVSTTFRGNGLFSGLILIYDAVSSMSKIVHSANIQANMRKLFVVCLSGVLMACIAILPQFLAYKEYCTNFSAETPVRPWCSSWVPSIYAWVQKEYWGVGFLKYWTLSNLPLFILAAPMLYILLQSGYRAWRVETFMIVVLSQEQSKVYPGEVTRTLSTGHDLHIDSAIACRFAIPQIVLATLALTSYHVQIINRLSSGYPVWYWWLASLILEDRKSSFWGMKFHYTSVVTRWIVIYAMVQGGLFASFLPPA